MNPAQGEVTITCGVSEALADSLLALTEPGDEVVILEPWYENYLPACVLAGGAPVSCRCAKKTTRSISRGCGKAVTNKTRLMILNTPGNPSGRVLSREELSEIAAPLPALRRHRRCGRDLRAHLV